MSRFAPRAALGFSVKMKWDAGCAESCPPIRFTAAPEIAQQVNHRRGFQKIGHAKRETANRAHVLLELAGAAAFNRPMPGIMRSRRELVHDQFTVALEKHLHRQKTDEA